MLYMPNVRPQRVLAPWAQYVRLGQILLVTQCHRVFQMPFPERPRRDWAKGKKGQSSRQGKLSHWTPRLDIVVERSQSALALYICSSNKMGLQEHRRVIQSRGVQRSQTCLLTCANQCSSLSPNRYLGTTGTMEKAVLPPRVRLLSFTSLKRGISAQDRLSTTYMVPICRHLKSAPENEAEERWVDAAL